MENKKVKKEKIQDAVPQVILMNEVSPNCKLTETKNPKIWIDINTGILFAVEEDAYGKYYLNQLNR